MAELAIIGGSGLTRLDVLREAGRQAVDTPFGKPSAPLVLGSFKGQEIIFLPRHGDQHTIPPHKVNYRANIWALKQLGAKRIIGIAAVGGISPESKPGTIAVPDQIIDYTCGRQHTYFEEDLAQVTHIDFTHPYCEELRGLLIAASAAAGVAVNAGGTYGATQGPRLETAMEINRMARDGCDLVGMTGMPEAALARELDVCYACCSVVANWAAGRGIGPITMQEIEKNLTAGMAGVITLLSRLVADNAGY
jgi:5'-deoxy-5'-methylthioadenosine phosphorylase